MREDLCRITSVDSYYCCLTSKRTKTNGEQLQYLPLLFLSLDMLICFLTSQHASQMCWGCVKKLHSPIGWADWHVLGLQLRIVRTQKNKAEGMTLFWSGGDSITFPLFCSLFLFYCQIGHFSCCFHLFMLTLHYYALLCCLCHTVAIFISLFSPLLTPSIYIPNTQLPPPPPILPSLHFPLPCFRDC